MPGPPAPADPRSGDVHGRALLLGAVVVAGALLVLAARAVLGDGGTAPITPQPPIAFSFEPLPSAIELQSAPPGPDRSTRPPARPAPTGRTWSPVAGRATTAPSTPAPAADLAVGRTVGLELAGRSGLRVRHRDFLGRVDPVTAASGATARLDATFTVRAGLAGRGCVSLESVNFPGRFLRHRDFVIHLDVRQDDPLYAADATFCAVPRSGGTSISLRAWNYPDRFVDEQRSALVLTARRPADATAYVVRPPL
ncbi:AbfB domain-containing protein [Couchioplanes caeruleus]|uniref:AbfB domain-containing protein n=1 Tax=Couchioplanes caeruleus TaxID=56438 RepID=UPI00201BAF3D|nr:AbfB domain-containing protein [Couchioplanes caeruleus]UQU61743.1 AbfB domain-containing protein [Couchioplanes caeruleus]